MEKKIIKINIQDYTDTQVLTVDADKATIAQIMELVAKLNLEINTPKEKPLQQAPKNNIGR